MSTRAAAGETLAWSLGFRNSAGKYLTAETFDFKLACAANTMKKKQIWFLEEGPKDDQGSSVHIRSHLDRYLRVDSNGDVHANSEKNDSDDFKECAFRIEAMPDGRWALQSQKYGWYFGGNGDKMKAFTDKIEEDKLWTVHLAMHPQVCIRNVFRKTYVHLDGQQLTTDEVIPWGDDATITLTFDDATGMYGLQASDGSFLSSTGELLSSLQDSAKWILVFQDNLLAFKSFANGKFLTSLGAKGTCKATKPVIGKDEQYALEDSFPQIKMTAVNGFKVSTKQGVELAATQSDTTDLEIFQVEPVGGSGENSWTIKCSNNKFWQCDDTSIKANADSPDARECKFQIQFDGPHIKIRASNGKFLVQKMNKYITATGSEGSVEEKSVFVYEIVNRPRLVLRGEYGFIGTLPSGLLECNKSVPEVYSMHISKGFAKISSMDTKYWKIGDYGVTCSGDSPFLCSGDSPEEYTLELFPESKLAIKNPSTGKYFRGHQNGALTCDAAYAGSKDTLFEY